MSNIKKDLLIKPVKKILELLGVEATAEITQKDDQIAVDIETASAGSLIGKQGQNLKALERVLQVIFYNLAAGEKSVLVDVAGFRQKRTQMIDDLVARTIEEVLSTKTARTLQGLSSSERKIIHLKITQTKGLASESYGVGEDRVLKIFPKE